MEKKVVFIGGTSFSGSTMLDLMLSNDQSVFSCGEVNALFYPYAKHHLSARCGCGNADCMIWQKALKQPPSEIYDYIFRMFPKINTIIDSSKDVLWISEQIARLQASSIKVSNVLIWKTPDEYRKSRSKRGKERGWELDWMNYHRSYFACIRGWRSAKYADVARSAECFEQICHLLNIPYFPGKERYWEKAHHTLFGNSSAKISLYPQGSDLFNRAHSERQGLSSSVDSADSLNYKNIAYEPTAPLPLLCVSPKIHTRLDDIIEKLEVRRICGKPDTTTEFSMRLSEAKGQYLIDYLSFPRLYIAYRKLIRRYRAAKLHLQS